MLKPVTPRVISLFFIILLLRVLCTPDVYAAGKIEIDDTKWISLGLGLRTSFTAQEDKAPNGNWGNDFNLDNLRLYVNGQIHKYIKVEFNTECDNCTSSDPTRGGNMIILDAIGKFEFNQYFNIWAGRQLVPQHRAELDGPFFQNVYNFTQTPFYTADFSGSIGQGGRFGRDDGVNIWGALTPDRRLTYVLGVFQGHRGGSNQSDSLLYAGRISYNFLNIEQNPGYYTSSTYYGKGGDILTAAYVLQYQNNGAGTEASPSTFYGMNGDLLFEKVLGNKGVLTVEGELKYFNPNLSDQALADPNCFCIFSGLSWMTTGLYLFPQKVGIGQFQPYVRYVDTNPNESSSRYLVEGGLNYVIDGHNARISLFYQYGDFLTKGRTYTPGVKGDAVSAVGLGLQLQL
ncbi:hypothetical protein [Nitrospira sp. Ecomares 2.1]